MRIVWDAVKYAFGRGPLYGIGLGALFGTIVYPVIGTLYGLFVGGVMGSLMTIPMGLLVGWITYQFFYPLTNSTRYRWTIFIVCWVASDIGATFCQIFIYGMWAVSSFNLSSLMYFQIPALIASGAAIHAGQGFANQYIKNANQSPTLISQAHPSSELVRGHS
jgi:hypothetical protein